MLMGEKVQGIGFKARQEHEKPTLMYQADWTYRSYIIDSKYHCNLNLVTDVIWRGFVHLKDFDLLCAGVRFPRDLLVKDRALDKHHDIIFIYNLEERLLLLNEGQTVYYLLLLKVVEDKICVFLGFCFPEVDH